MKNSDKIRELEAKVAMLQMLVSSLEQRLKILEIKPATPYQPLPYQPSGPWTPNTNPPHPTWIPPYIVTSSSDVLTGTNGGEHGDFY